MRTTITGTPRNAPYRYVMAVLILLCPFCTMIPYVAPAVFMTDIMASFSVDMSLAGLGMTIMLGASGVCMFIGTFIQDRLGIRRSIIVALAAMVLGNLAAFASPNIVVFLLARLVGGFGQGVYMVCSTPCISSWFAGKQRTYMITFNSVVNAIALATSYAINRPLAELLGGWQNTMALYAGVVAVVAVLWIFLSKDAVDTAAIRKNADAAAPKKKGSLLRACKEIQYWKIMLYAGLFYMANSSITTFLPTYLQTERGVSANVATTITSLNSLAGMAGSLLGGVLVAQLPKRKPIMLIATIAYMVVGFGLTIFTSNGLVLVLALIVGALFNAPTTAQSTLMIETKQPMDPTILGGAVSITTGISQLLCVFVSFIFNAVVKVTSMTVAYRVFFGLMIIAAAMVLWMRETGTSKKK